MNVLLDTCALLALADGNLPREAAAALRVAPEAYVSVVTPWEVAIKVAGGKLQLGTWQSVLLVESNGPRDRRVVVTVLAVL